MTLEADFRDSPVVGDLDKGRVPDQRPCQVPPRQAPHQRELISSPRKRRVVTSELTNAAPFVVQARSTMQLQRETVPGMATRYQVRPPSRVLITMWPLPVNQLIHPNDGVVKVNVAGAPDP